MILIRNPSSLAPLSRARATDTLYIVWYIIYRLWGRNRGEGMKRNTWALTANSSICFSYMKSGLKKKILFVYELKKMSSNKSKEVLAIWKARVSRAYLSAYCYQGTFWKSYTNWPNLVKQAQPESCNLSLIYSSNKTMGVSVGKRKGIYLKTLQWLKYFSKNSWSFYIPLFTHPESEFASSLTHVSLFAKAPVKKLDLKKGKSKWGNRWQFMKTA